MKLHNDSKGYSTITSVRGVVKPALQMPYNEDIIHRNPFDFRPSAVRERGGKYYVEKTKTKCGCRYIPMTEEVFQSLNNILASRKKVKTEIVVDGYGSFLLLDKDNKSKVVLHIENEMRWEMKKYKKLHPDKPLPHITPHVFRHTFCANMANGENH